MSDCVVLSHMFEGKSYVDEKHVLDDKVCLRNKSKVRQSCRKTDLAIERNVLS